MGVGSSVVYQAAVGLQHILGSDLSLCHRYWHFPYGWPARLIALVCTFSPFRPHTGFRIRRPTWHKLTQTLMTLHVIPCVPFIGLLKATRYGTGPYAVLWVHHIPALALRTLWLWYVLGRLATVRWESRLVMMACCGSQKGYYQDS